MRLALLAVALCGCSVSADFSGTRYACSDGRCPGGFQCVASFCEVATADAAIADAAIGDGATDDGPQGDGAVGDGRVLDGALAPDAAPPDAGVDPCGKVSILADNFDDGVRSSDWGYSGSDPGVTVSETGGHAVITLAVSTAGSLYGYYDTQRRYDATNDRVYVEVVMPANPASQAQATLEVIAGNGQRVQLAQSGGMLAMEKQVGGAYNALATIPYNAVAHRWWQIRESAGRTFWETSPDGVTWTTRASAADPVPMTSVEVQLAAGTESSMAAPGQAIFDNLNGGTSVGHWCKTASLTDAFTAPNPAVWSRAYSAGGCVMTTSGLLSMTPTGTAGSGCADLSGPSYDLRASSLLIEVPLVTSTATEANVEMMVRTVDGSYAGFTEHAGMLQLNRHVAGSAGSSQVGVVPYSASAHRWWRLREAGGTLFYEAAADGRTWVPLGSAVAGFALDVLDVQLRTATDITVASPGAAHYDNLNLPP